MAAEVVAAEQGVALVEPTRPADVQVGVPGSTHLAKSLLELVWAQAEARRLVVADEVRPLCEPKRLEDVADAIERIDGDLDIDHVLGGESGHGRRADVIDAQGEIAERVTQGRPDLQELLTPAWVRFDDLCGGSHLSRRVHLVGVPAVRWSDSAS
jgi:hypothetical protein